MILTPPLLALATLAVQDYDPPPVKSPDPSVTAQDNVVGGFVYLQTSPLEMISSHPTLSEYTLVQNGPRGRLELYYGHPDDLGHPARVADAPTSRTVTSMVVRPGTDEVWLADPYTRHASGSGGVIGVFDGIRETYVASIRVPDEPTSLAFTPDGRYAFGAASGSRSVFVIDCDQRQVVDEVSTGQFTPHALVFLPQSSEIVVASLLSGNNTTTAEYPQSAALNPQRVVNVTAEGGNALPDRDLVVISFDPNGTKKVKVTDVVRGVGTVLYNLAVRPGTRQLLVPNTEALNADFRGERNFIAGQVVENRLTLVDLDQPPGSRVQHLVLDGDPVRGGLGTPTDVVFPPHDPSHCYVVCRGSDKVVEVRINSGVMALGDWWTIGSSDPSVDHLVGARTAAVSNDARWLSVYCEVELGFASIDLAQVGGGRLVPTTPLSYNPIPSNVRRGNAFASDVGRSASETSSCTSCHVDGHQDMLAWDLSKWLDPEGTPADALQFEQDFKGPMLTQTLRGLPEVGPYHWRGEQHELGQFNGTFPDLLEGPPLDVDSELPDLVAYLSSLRFPPNPRQNLDRSYAGTPARNGKGDAGLGLTAFKTAGTLICANCHNLPTGTNNEIQRLEILGPPSFTTQVAHLRGVADKLAPEFDTGLASGNLGLRTEIGNGLTHAAGEPSLLKFVQAFPNLSDDDVSNLVAFLEAFDTGLAPATAYMATFTDATPNLGGAWSEAMAFVRSQSFAGNADFALLTSIETSDGVWSPVTLVWDTLEASWRAGFVHQQLYGESEVLEAIESGIPVTILGLAPGSGTYYAIDTDGDGLLDYDEYGLGTSSLIADTDGDGRVDGQEVRHGTDPTTADAPADTSPATVLDAVVLYTTTNTAKVELHTDEPARVTGATVGPFAIPFATTTLGPQQWHTTHQVVLQQLPFQFELVFFGLFPLPVTLEVTDRAGNTSQVTVNVSTGVRSDVVKVQEITGATYDSAMEEATFFVSLKRGTQPAAPRPLGLAGYQVQCIVTFGQDLNGEFKPITSLATELAPALGTSGKTEAPIEVRVALPKALLDSVAQPRIAVAVHDVAAPEGGPSYRAPQSNKQDFRILDFGF